MTLAFSPCPNDTFIFDALVNGKIDTGGLNSEVYLEDVQTLNEWAMQGKMDITKISYGVLPKLLERYALLDAGGALGKGVGPLLIARPEKMKELLQNDPALKHASIAIPGADTTAHMLFSMAYPSAHNKRFLVFNEIEDAVLGGQADAGVIIHENRFTYQNKGLSKIADLGEYWESELRVPIPLGGIVMKKSFGGEMHSKINGLIRKSVEYAFANYPALPDYVREHSQEMSEDVMRSHIDLYVNNYSLDLGPDGHQAVSKLLHIATTPYPR